MSLWGKYRTTIDERIEAKGMRESKVLGTKISCIASYDEAYLELIRVIRNGGRRYITVNNVHTVTQAVLQNEYKNILNTSVLSLPDGKPLSVILQRRGEKHISRIFGPTFFEYTLRESVKDNISHFFFGSSPGTLEKLRANIEAKYPSTKVVGMISPPFREFSDRENGDFIEAMNSAKADVVWVGLGAPKQERWMHNNYQKLNCGVMIGIGSGFDYVAGNTKHAPEWMKNMSLEWVFRLMQEPKRLWKRYLVTNTLFLLFMTLECLGLKKFED